MIAAQSQTPPDVVHVVGILDQDASSIRALEVDNSYSDYSAALYFNVATVNYRPAEDKQTRMSHHTVVFNDSLHSVQNWWRKADLLEKYSSSYNDLISILAASQ